MRTRAVALARLRRQFPSRCEADREDAVHEALCAALRVGKADSTRTVCGWAARRLLGTTRERGVVRSARSPATSIAGPCLPHDDERLEPSDWLDQAAEAARVADLDGVLDAFAERERAEAEALAAAARRREAAEERRRRAAEACIIVPLAARACGSMALLARALGVSASAPYRWRDPRDFSPPGAELMQRLRALAAGPAEVVRCWA